MSYLEILKETHLRLKKSLLEFQHMVLILVPAVAAIGQPIVASGGRPTFPRRPQNGRWRSELNEMDSKRPISAKNQIDEEKKQIFEKADLEPLNLKLSKFSDIPINTNSII